MRDPDRWLIRLFVVSGCLLILLFALCFVVAVGMQLRESDEKAECRQGGGAVLVSGGEWYCAHRAEVAP